MPDTVIDIAEKRGYSRNIWRRCIKILKVIIGKINTVNKLFGVKYNYCHNIDGRQQAFYR